MRKAPAVFPLLFLPFAGMRQRLLECWFLVMAEKAAATNAPAAK
jgi:hypothetical protein